MTNIINFNEKIKGASTNTDNFFASFNRFHEAKLTGALKENEFSELLILENKFFANLVRKGKVTEEDVETYDNDMPNGKYPIGKFPHKDLDLACKTVKQSNTVALFDAENLNKQTHISDHSKGLRKVA